MKKEGRISSIDLLRAIAIVMVISFHLLYQITQDNSLRPIGFVAISLFFILSGFILAKKYPKLDSFSIKWFFKRYLRVAILYYIALVAVVLIFSKQVYSGSLFKNLLYHFAFIGFISKETAYGIISPAWFVIPLIGLYILYPYLNKFIKKNPIFLIFAFLITFWFRYTYGGLTSFCPMFFLGEFCFGIAFAHNKNNWALLISIITIAIAPFMILPYLIFYILYYIDNKYLPSKILGFIGANTLMLFLFHEAYIRVALGDWHIYSLSKFSSLTLLSIIMISSNYTYIKIQKFFRKHIN
ncbi:MAG: acyltransferase family protein [archaeon]